MRVQRNIKSVQLTRHLFFFSFFYNICGWNAHYSWFREPHNESLIFTHTLGIKAGVTSSDPSAGGLRLLRPTSPIPPFSQPAKISPLMLKSFWIPSFPGVSIYKILVNGNLHNSVVNGHVNGHVKSRATEPWSGICDVRCRSGEDLREINIPA